MHPLMVGWAGMKSKRYRSSKQVQCSTTYSTEYSIRVAYSAVSLQSVPGQYGGSVSAESEIREEEEKKNLISFS